MATCSTCPFWKQTFRALPARWPFKALPAFGECHRFAYASMFVEGRWARVNATDWCGEHPERAVSKQGAK